MKLPFGFRKFLKKIKNKRWISVNDKLPKTGDMIVCTDDEGNELELGFRSEIDNDKKNWVDFSFPVSYFYPIPDLDDISFNIKSEIERYDYISDKIKSAKTQKELNYIIKLTKKFEKNISNHNNNLPIILKNKIEKKSSEIKFMKLVFN